jgi:hypothetical protein
VDGGEYAYSGPVGIWTGDAASVVFTAASNQVRASQIVVKIDKSSVTTDIDHMNTPSTTSKILRNGQIYILREGKTYSLMGIEVE